MKLVLNKLFIASKWTNLPINLVGKKNPAYFVSLRRYIRQSYGLLVVEKNFHFLRLI